MHEHTAILAVGWIVTERESKGKEEEGRGRWKEGKGKKEKGKKEKEKGRMGGGEGGGHTV